jgi:hypothetical protein
MRFAQRVRRATALLLLTLCLIPQASAHSAPEKARSFYGGIAQTTETFNLELLLQGDRLQLFVRDRHNWPLDIRGFGATALLWGKDGSTEIELSPGERSALIAEQAALVTDLERVVITLRAPGHEPVTAWFKAQRS